MASRLFDTPAIGVLVVVMTMAGACSDDPPTGETDSGPRDGGAFDAARSDSGPIDAGNLGDSGEADAGTATVDPAAQSGTRLRRRFLDGQDGAERTVDFWDNELGVDCAYERAADGELRCLPSSRRSVAYRDSACTEPLIVWEENPCGVEFAVERVDDVFRMYRITDTPVVLSGGQFYVRSGGCFAVDVTARSEVVAVEPMPSIRFVAGTERIEDRAGSLVARYIDGEDGSHILVETLHQAFGESCRFLEEEYCLPSGVGYLTSFSDIACTEPIAHGTEPPTFLVLEDRGVDTCVAGRTYFERGTSIVPEYTYNREPGAGCIRRTNSAGATYYRPGAPVPLTRFPALSTVREGSGRLRAMRRVDSEGAALGAGHTFWDTELDTTCNIAELPDGELRCLPYGWGEVRNHFGSAGCTDQPLIEHLRCSPHGPIAYDDGTRDQCASGVYWSIERLHARGAAHSGPIYWGDAGLCGLFDARASEIYYEISADVPSPSDFAAVTLRVE